MERETFPVKVKLPSGTYFVQSKSEGRWKYRKWGEIYWTHVTAQGMCETHWSAGREWELPEALQCLTPEFAH